MACERTFSAELEIAKPLAALASENALHYFHRRVSADTKAEAERSPIHSAGAEWTSGKGASTNGLIHRELKALLEGKAS